MGGGSDMQGILSPRGVCKRKGNMCSSRRYIMGLGDVSYKHSICIVFAYKANDPDTQCVNSGLKLGR